VTSCRKARAAILAVVRQQVTEAERLLLDEHLAMCASCRSEKARWRLMERLRDEEPAHLGTDARQRVLQSISTRGIAESDAREPRCFRYLTPFALAGVAVTAALLVFAVRVSRNPPDQAVADRHAESSQAPVVEAQTIRAQAPGSLTMPGARIAYIAGSTLRILAGGRRVEIYAGEVDVEVAPGGPGRFRVVAPRFIVEVVGTHFVVRPSGVKTLHGTVRVLDASGRELAVLHASEAWQVGDPNQLPLALVDNGIVTGPPESAVAPPPAGDAPATIPRKPLAGPTRPLAKSGFDLLIAEARSHLAAGDPEVARERIASALGTHPPGRQRATAGLLIAASFLVERRYDEALTAYRRTAELFGKYPESETAAFAIAQLLCERAAGDDARAALAAYIERYPEGRFVQDARRKLASLP
jgi:Putative zinc-finger/FecR protein